MKPIIGIACGIRKVNYYDLHIDCWLLPDGYVNSVVKSGGQPVIIPCSTPELELTFPIDGLIISGGGDISAEFYGEKCHHESYGHDSLRDQFEINLVRNALSEGIPLLAICRGLQVLNIAMGGSLIQHIPDQVHEGLHHWPDNSDQIPTHLVRVSPGKLAKAMELGETEKEIEVNSFHHQAISRLGSNLIVSARAGDDIIEAIEVKSQSWALGVQWHPELMASHIHKKLFEELVAQAIKRKK